jgi:hypothetical protein
VDTDLFVGWNYIVMMGVAAVMMVWYIWYLHGNRERSARYEEYSNLVLHDELTDQPMEDRENAREEKPSKTKKDER